MLEISGDTLTTDQVASIASDRSLRVAVAPNSLAAVARAHACLTRMIDDEVIYGVNTGFGPMACVVLGPGDLIDLQYNLLRSHAVGIGAPLPERFVRAAMVTRLNTLAKGYSGVSCDLLTTLAVLINEHIVPVVPEHGAVGASGDLVQLAHIALALIGEGEVLVDGVRRPTQEVLAARGIAPHVLQPKEGLALINGTAMMTGIAALLCAEVERLIEWGIHAGALSLEIVGAFDDGFSEQLQAVRPHPGQDQVARRLREHLKGSRRLRRRETALKGHAQPHIHRMSAPVQEVYSIRCIPQILGPVHDTLDMVKRRIEVELNAVTDNPIVCSREWRVLHGGNFHGDYVSLSMDELKIAVIKLGMLSERRINSLLNPNIPHPWAPFMNRRTPGLTLALQGLQFVATSTAAQSQTLGFPQYLHSITTNGDNQDVVSLGTDAALLAAKAIANAFVIVTIEAVVLAQAVDCLEIEQDLCESSQRLFREVRDLVRCVDEDRVLTPDLEMLLAHIRGVPASIASALGSAAGVVA